MYPLVVGASLCGYQDVGGATPANCVQVTLFQCDYVECSPPGKPDTKWSQGPTPPRIYVSYMLFKNL